MIVMGDVSGIQRYVFDVAEEGGGQAQRLRARSFFVQLVCEASQMHVAGELGWRGGVAKTLYSAAGKFALEGPPVADAHERLRSLSRRLNARLREEAGGELRLSLAGSDDAVPPVTQYDKASARLQAAKARPFADLAVEGGVWTADLVLPPLGTPCVLCRRRPADRTEKDADGGRRRRVCNRCAEDRAVGRRLPTARWLAFRGPVSGDSSAGGPTVLGLRYELDAGADPPAGPDLLAVANLDDPDRPPPGVPPERVLHRRLARHIPVDHHGAPVWFTELADRAHGATLLGVLKADVDSLGAAFEGISNQGLGLKHRRHLSEALDAFFAGRVNDELESDPRWDSLYCVFAGGDDLLLVGPWDVAFDFAGHLHALFQERFGKFGLTFSAGLALVRPKFPIKHAVAQAEELLEHAKTHRAAGETVPKDQFAAFGGLWKWGDHEVIATQVRQLVAWHDARILQRGWLHTMLQLADDRTPDPPGLNDEQRRRRAAARQLAPARLTAHIARNWPAPGRGTPDHQALRRWADQTLAGFDDPRDAATRCLRPILRCALTATRSPSEDR